MQNYGRLINRMNAYSIEKMIVVTKRLLEQEGDDSSWILVLFWLDFEYLVWFHNVYVVLR